VLGLLFIIIGLWFLRKALPRKNVEDVLVMWVSFCLFWAVGITLLVYGWRAIRKKLNR
jgi:hypothetical protein